MKIYRITTSGAMQTTPEVLELIKQGKNPYDYIEPSGPIITTIKIVGTR